MLLRTEYYPSRRSVLNALFGCVLDRQITVPFCSICSVDLRGRRMRKRVLICISCSPPIQVHELHAMKRHSGFEKQNIVHRKTMFSRLSLDTSLVERSLCLSIASTTLYEFVGERSVGDQKIQHGEDRQSGSERVGSPSCASVRITARTNSLLVPVFSAFSSPFDPVRIIQ